MRSLYLSRRLFIALAASALLFVVAFLMPEVMAIANVALVSLCILLLFDLFLLYRKGGRIEGRRGVPERLSNGDENILRIDLVNHYPFAASIVVIDELPHQFQVRDFEQALRLPAGGVAALQYSLRPVERGEYDFGALNLFAASPIGFVRRRFRYEEGKIVPVYPSYLQMRRYELMAHSHRLSEIGIKKVRRVGQTMEFDQIRTYVPGDDVRTLNWKATARRAELMVNQFQDERSQQVYSLIDKGRTMKMPFEEMTLLDYAINASLVISSVAVNRHDRAGLVTFSNTIGTIVPAERRRAQMQKINEVLYNQSTQFFESNFELLYATIRQRITTRSLLMLYTNFETLSALERQLPYLQRIAQSHLLVVIFFENTELRRLIEGGAVDTETVYIKAVAEQFALEKKQIVKELERHGIHAILTTPQALTVNAINKYLEVKARRLI